MKQATIAAIRFGYGLGAGRLAGSAPDIMQSLRAADAMVSAYPLLSLAEALALRRNYFKTQDAEASGDPEGVRAGRRRPRRSEASPSDPNTPPRP